MDDPILVFSSNLRRFLLAVSFLGAGVACCPAETVVVEFEGKEDPTAGSAAFLWKRSDPAASDAPVSNPLPARRIRTEGKALFYSYEPPPSDLEKAEQEGWTLSAKVRLDTATVPFPRRFATVFLFESPAPHGRWVVHIQVDEKTGELFADVNNKPVPLRDLAPDAPHLYELRYDPVSKTAQFFADGMPFADSVQPLEGNRTRVAWGNVSSGPPSSAEWAAIKLAIPDPN